MSTDPYAFASTSGISSLPKTVTISATGSTAPAAALPNAAQMFQQAALNSNTDNKPTQTTSFNVDTTNIDRLAASSVTFRDRRDDDDDDNDDDDDGGDRFDVFKTAQEHIDQTMFQSAFEHMTVNSIAQQREEIDQAKLAALQDSLNDGGVAVDDDWMMFLSEFDEQVAKVETDLKKQQELELNNSLALIGEAIKNNTTISLPSQSKESRELTDHITKLYAEFNEKKKSKEMVRQMRNHNINNTVGMKPLPGSSLPKGNKNKKAANKAMDRFSRLEAMSHQENVETRRRQGNGQIDFLNDHTGPYKKQSQANKKKNKKLDW